MTTPNATPYGWFSDEEDILPIEPLLRHWGKPHVTDCRACFCWPLQVDGVPTHRRMPWERSPGVRKAEYGERNAP